MQEVAFSPVTAATNGSRARRSNMLSYATLVGADRTTASLQVERHG